MAGIHTPLERGVQLTTLGGLVTEERSHGRIVLVTGEAGIGKSSLLRCFAERHAHRVDVVFGLCDPLARSRPLGPLYDIARQVGGPLSKALASRDEPAAVFAAFLDELSRRGRRTVVVLEDVHWADDTTLDLLAFLGRRLDRTPTLVVLTYRDDELGLNHPLHAVLDSLPGDRVSELPMPPLSPDAVTALADKAGYPPAGLHAITGGNPLMVTELLAAGVAAGVPQKLRALVRSRLSGLDAGARDAVHLVAVSPAGAELWLLEGAGVACPEGLAGGLLVHAGDRVRFRHEVLRRALLESMSATIRYDANRRVLEVLSSTPSCRERDPARLVHHARECDDADAVLRHASAAACRAAADKGHHAAVAHYETALRYADRLVDHERADLLERLAHQAFLAGGVDRALAARQAALAVWKAAGRAEKTGENLRWLSRLFSWTGQREEAELAGARAIEVLEPSGPGRQLALAYGERSRLDLLVHHPAAAIAWAARGVRMARRLDDPVSLATALTDLGAARLAAGESAGRADVERAAALAREHGLIDGVATALTTLATHCVVHREHRRAQADLDEALRFAADHGLLGLMRLLTSMSAWFRLNRGDWVGAEEDALRVLDGPDEPGAIAVTALCVVGRIHARRGGSPRAASLRKARTWAWKAGEVQGVALAAAVRAELAWLRYAADPGVDELTRAFELAHRAHHPWHAGELAWWLHRMGANPLVSDWYAEPYRLLLAGDWRQAADAWRDLGCPYEQADALASGKEVSAGLHALEIFDRLGADGAARRLRRWLRSLGGPRVPRGPRRSTAANPANLTARQLEVLGLLARNLSNADIAARLSLSVRTVDHHVSAVLAKLNVGSRRQAATVAQRLGIVPAAEVSYRSI